MRLGKLSTMSFLAQTARQSWLPRPHGLMPFSTYPRRRIPAFLRMVVKLVCECVCVCVCVCIKHKSMSGFGILFCFSPAVAQEILRKAVSDTRNRSRALIADTAPCLGASVESVEIVLHGAVCADGSRPALSDTNSGSCSRSTVSELKQPGHISARPGLVQCRARGPALTLRGVEDTAPPAANTSPAAERQPITT